LAVKGEHILVLKTPIDINLAKELNILSYDMGLSLDKMIIDTDIGGLGYGLEYGYSIMEKIKIEGLKGDEYLNMPLISFAPNESLKTKEAKTNLTDSSWGNLEYRARYFEIASASAVMASGANLIVLNYPPNVKLFKELVK
jgi:CO dehydrogenase/acetyl-CoA synthase delta subunit